MLRRNGPVIKPWSQSWGQEGSPCWERFVKEVPWVLSRVWKKEGVMDGESGELTGNWAWTGRWETEGLEWGWRKELRSWRCKCNGHPKNFAARCSLANHRWLVRIIRQIMNHFACTLLHCACPWEGDCLFCFVFVYLNDFCVGIVSILSVIYIFQNTLINVVVIARIFSSLLHVFEEFGFCFRHLHSSAGERLFISLSLLTSLVGPEIIERLASVVA